MLIFKELRVTQSLKPEEVWESFLSDRKYYFLTISFSTTFEVVIIMSKLFNP